VSTAEWVSLIGFSICALCLIGAGILLVLDNRASAKEEEKR